MLRRLLVGLFWGAVIGVAAAAALVFGLKVSAFDGAAGSLEAYGAALAVGMLAGLVTGKPIWASDAKVEAGVKAFFGALLAAGGMFALRRWAPSISLPAPVGTGAPLPLGDLPASLAVVGATLGALFEVDNTIVLRKNVHDFPAYKFVNCYQDVERWIVQSWIPEDEP